MIKIPSISTYILRKSYINEMSQLINRFDKLTEKEIEDWILHIYNDEKDNLYKIKDNVYKIMLDKSLDIVFYITDKLEGATVFEADGVKFNNKEYFVYVPKITKKFKTSNEKGIMYKIYSAYYHLKKSYIMSDSKQTEDSKRVWKQWFNNKTTFNIKEARCIDTSKNQEIQFNDIEDSWCKSVECQKYRIIIKFDK